MYIIKTELARIKFLSLQNVFFFTPYFVYRHRFSFPQADSLSGLIILMGDKVAFSALHKWTIK